MDSNAATAFIHIVLLRPACGESAAPAYVTHMTYICVVWRRGFGSVLSPQAVAVGLAIRSNSSPSLDSRLRVFGAKTNKRQLCRKNGFNISMTREEYFKQTLTNTHPNNYIVPVS